jgi:DNA-binding GntR family transcriptional regulator
VRHTIAVLVDEGYAYAVPGRGTYASPKDQADQLFPLRGL